MMETLLRRIRLPRPRLRQKIQILSDLHLEVGQQYASFTFPVSAPLLLLAGDIGRLMDYAGYLHFLQAQTARYKKVFLVLGNHEFYGLDHQAGMAEAVRLSGEGSLAGRLVLLNRARWDDPDSRLTILGCTLWSCIPESACSIVETKVNDFRQIGGWTAHRHSQVHAEELSWLREQVAEIAADSEANSQRQVLIATHHAPSMDGTSRPEHASNPWTPAFATDLLGQDDWPCVRVWVFGHTHYSTDVVQNSIRLVANQRGYVFPGSAAMAMAKKSDRSRERKKDREFDPSKNVAL